MTMWEQLDNYIIRNNLIGREFNSHDLAQTLSITAAQASAMIQAYLVAQRSQNSSTQFTLHRFGRTSTAMWRVGSRSNDVRELTRQCMNDISIKVTEALAPDLAKMGILNPRCAALVNAMTQVFIANVNLLATQVP